MRTARFGYVTAAAAIVGLLAAPALAQVKRHDDIKYPRLPEWKIPSPEVYELGNGMKVFLMEDHELPLISVTARIRTGSLYEPADKAGLASMMGQVQREGGTTSMSGDEIDDYLGNRAASVETSIGQEAGFASMNCLEEDFDDVLRVFNDVLRNPAFPEDKLELARVQANTNIARRNDDVGQITQREFTRLMYGADSPLARNVEYATVGAITRDDLVAWHEKHYHPNNVLLGVVGDFDSNTMKQKLETTFGGWAKGPGFTPAEVPHRKTHDGGVYFIPKDDVTQANIRMGHLGITQKNPDYFSVQVMNEVLGGSFASRLFSNVRSKKGLAYSVFGGVGASFDHPGVCQVGLQTKSETMAEAVEALREEVMGIIENPPDDAELQRAKDSILNSFVFNYASKGQILAQQMTYAYYGMPADFLERYRSNIDKVSKDEVARVAKKYVLPDQAVLLVVGNREDFDRPVETFGKVTEIDISIPPMPDTTPKAERTAAALGEGASVFSRVVDKLGGPEPASVESFRVRARATLKMGGQALALSQTVTLVYPDKMHVAVQTPMGEQVQSLSGDQGFVMMGGQSQPMPERAVSDLKQRLARDLGALVRFHDDPDLEAVFAGKEIVEETPCEIVEVTFRGAKSRLWVAPDGRVLKQSFQASNPMTGAPGSFEVVYEEYEEADGRWVPVRSRILIDGQETISQEVEEFEINPQVDMSLFEKPAA